MWLKLGAFMSIRRIKANNAFVDGDYVTVETNSMKFMGAIFGFLFGVFICVISNNVQADGFFYIILVTTVFGFLIGVLIFPGKVVRQIPTVDLVEIKRYPSTHKVTVVLDDERTKRRQPVSSIPDEQQ